MTKGAPSTIIAVALTVLLAGCAPSGPLSPDGSPQPTSAAAAGAPTDIAAPTSRVPLRCDQLASIGAVATAVGQPLDAVAPISVDYIPALTPFASVQHGDLGCAWSPTPLTYNAQPPYVSILIVPDVTDAQWATVVGGVGEASEGLFAGDSHSLCTSDGDVSQCRLDTRVNGYWLSVSANALAGEATPESTTQLFASAASTVESAGTADAAWPLPVDVGASGTIDTSLASASLGAAVRQVDCNPTHEGQDYWVAIADTGLTSCTYSTTGMSGGADAFITVTYLPGGAWALPSATIALGAEATAVAGLGEGAFSIPDGPGAASTVFARGSDLVSVHSSGAGVVELTEQAMTSIVAAIARSLPTV